MDVRIVNKKREIVNVSELSVGLMGKWLVGRNERKEVVQIEEYESEEEAKKVLEEIVEYVKRGTKKRYGAIVIEL